MNRGRMGFITEKRTFTYVHSRTHRIPAMERNTHLSTRAQALAARIEQGARELAAVIEECSPACWEAVCPAEGWTVAVTAHHVASMYPIELNVVHVLASGQAVTGVTWDVVNDINATHAADHAHPTKEETLALLRENSTRAVDQVRGYSDEELDRAATVSLHANAPLTAQYFIEQHPLSHPYIHLESIRAALAACAA